MGDYLLHNSIIYEWFTIPIFQNQLQSNIPEEKDSSKSSNQPMDDICGHDFAIPSPLQYNLSNTMEGYGNFNILNNMKMLWASEAAAVFLPRQYMM